jgi:outer membrane protein OmpA-like peptidoglycan-associated protein
VPTLKETLGKVQSNSENRAVEDLIKKLKGVLQEPAPTPAAPEEPKQAKRADSAGAASVDLEIFFAYKSTAITPQAASALVPLGRALGDARLAGNTFLIAGHSDGKGSAEYNVDLSQQRAEAVRLYLITKFGIDPERLIARGMGAKQLKNAKDPLAAENRRVQIVNVSRGEGMTAPQR